MVCPISSSRVGLRWGDVARFPWTIDYAPDFASDAAVLARWASTNLTGKKLAVVYPDNDFGKDYLAGFVAGLADRSQLVASNAYPANAANANDQITTVKNEAADAVLIVAGPETTAASITFATTIQYAPQWLISYTNARAHLRAAWAEGLRRSSCWQVSRCCMAPSPTPIC